MSWTCGICKTKNNPMAFIFHGCGIPGIGSPTADPSANPSADDVNHPKHYTSNASGIECIQVTEHMNFCLGNAIKYIWRAGIKSDDAEKDLRKAIWYIERELKRIGK